MLDALEPAFAERTGFRRIYLDLPGHGGSDGVGIACQDDVLVRVADFTASMTTDRFAVIGESRGSLIARGLIARMRDRVSGACLIVPGGDDATSGKPAHQTLVPAPALRETLPEVARARFDRLVVQTAEIADRIVATKLPAAALADAETARRIAAHFSLTDPLEALPFDGPSLIVAGRQDAIAGVADATRIQHAFPRATFAILDTAGHSLTWERPALFRALLDDWLTRLDTAP